MEFIQNHKKFLSIYLVWVFIQLYAFIYSKHRYSWKPIQDKVHIFYPFEETINGYSTVGLYDITELMVYALVPLLIYFIYFAFKKPKK